MLMDTRHTEQDVLSLPHEATGAEPAPVHPSSPASAKKTTQERTCLVDRTTHAKADLFRFVCGPDQKLYFDFHQKLPGRGLYVRPDRKALETAIQKNLFSKAAKKTLTVPDHFMTQIETILHQSALDQIGLARRAGDLIISAEKIEKYLKANPLGVYLTTSLPEADTRRTIERRCRTTPTVTCFSQDDLSHTLNLENPVHLALKPGKICKKFLHLVETLNNLKETKD
ncbi:MAG: DUF448 domain-containing protein [Rhodospirillales bacterium]|nr:DUF448 domain-containing protein [Rhodospirillales bacterium]